MKKTIIALLILASGAVGIAFADNDSGNVPNPPDTMGKSPVYNSDVNANATDNAVDNTTNNTNQ